MSNIGVRNNNWLNIRSNPANDWVGQTEGEGNDYATFDDPVNGLRAGDIVLKNYGAKHGIDNINDAISRFAPPSDNNPTPAYAKFVADKMGIAASDKIDLSDEDTREKMIQAMVQFESPDAKELYSPELLQKARGKDISNANEEPDYTDLVAGFSQTETAEPAANDESAVDGVVQRDPIAQFMSGDLEEQTFAPSGLIETFRRGVTSGAESLGADLSYMGAALDTLQGDTEGAAQSIENARIQEEFAAIPMAGIEAFGEFAEEPTVGGFFTQVAAGTGQLIPSVISTVSGAGVGSIAMVLGKQALTQSSRQAAKNLIKDSLLAVSKKTATPDQTAIAQAAFEATKEARNVAIKQGALVGAGASEYAPLVGGNVSEALESGRELDRGQALRAGLVALPQAAVGLYGEVGLLKLLSKQALSKSAGPKSVMGVLSSSLSSFAKGGAIEGGTESIQEEISIRNRMDMDDTFDSADANLRRMNALFTGFFGGGALSGGGALAIDGAKAVVGEDGLLGAAASISEKAADMTDTIKETMTRNRSNADISQSAPDQTTKEPEADIDAQIRAMLDKSSSKEAVWISGSEPDSRIAGSKPNRVRKITVNGETAWASFIPGRGTVISTDVDAVTSVVKGQASDQVLAAALGYSNTKTNEDSLVVKVFDSFGDVVSEETTGPDGLVAAEAAADRLMPDGGRRETLSAEDALADRARRAGPEVKAYDEDEGFDPLAEDQNTNEEVGDGEFESTTSTHTFINKDNKETDSYKAEEGTNDFPGVDPARKAYAKVLGEDINWETPFYQRMSEGVLKTAAAVQKNNPTEGVTIQVNADGSYRIDIETTPDTQLIRWREPGKDDVELSMGEFLKKAINKAKGSKQEFRTVAITSEGSDKPVSVNPVDLMNAGRRIVESYEGSFTGSGDTDSSRQGLLAILGELDMNGYKVAINDVSIEDILNNISDPTKTLPPSIANIKVGFTAAGKAILLGKLLKPYVPGAPKVTNLSEVTDRLGNIGFVSDEDALIAAQDADPVNTDEMTENAARQAGITLTNDNIELGPRNVNTAQNRPKGSAPETNTDKPAPREEVAFGTGVTFPFGSINDIVGSLTDRLSRAIKLKTPVAIIGLKAFNEATRVQIGSYITGKKTAKGLIAVKKLKTLDLGDSAAVGGFIKQLQTDGLLDKKIAEQVIEADDATLVGHGIVMRAAVDIIRPKTSSRHIAEQIATNLVDSFTAKGRKGYHTGYSNGAVIMVNDLYNQNEAAIALVAAHEMGHALFAEEISGIIANPALKGRMYAAFYRDRQKARDEGKMVNQWETVGFEEWYADQVAAWAKNEVITDSRGAGNAVDSHFKRVVARFKKLWNAMKSNTGATYRRFNTLRPTFAKYMAGVTEARQSDRETTTTPVYNKAGEIVAYKSALSGLTEGPAPEVAPSTTPSRNAPVAPAPEQDSNAPENWVKVVSAGIPKWRNKITGELTAREVGTQAPKIAPAVSTPTSPPIEAADGGSGDGGNNDGPPPSLATPDGPSWEQKAVVEAMREQIVIEVGSKAKAQAWANKLKGFSQRFTAKNPNATKIIGMLFTADSMLSMVAGRKVADMFYIESNSRAGLGFVQGRTLARDKMRGDLFKVVGNDWTTQKVQDALKAAQSDTPTAGLEDPTAKAIRKFFEDVHKSYVEPSNTNIGFRDNFFPVLLNMPEIAHDPYKFVQLIMANDPKANRKTVQKAVKRITKYQNSIDLGDSTAGPDKEGVNFADTAKVAEETRKLTKNLGPTILGEAGFLQEPEIAMLSYIDNITKRVEWNRNTKDANGVDKLEPALAGLAASQREIADSVIHAYLGHQTPLSPFWRKTTSYLQTMNIVTLLPFAAFASIPDFAGSIVNTREFGGFAMFGKQMISQMKDKESAQRLAYDLGVVMPEAAANAWMSQADSDMLDPKVRQATDKFFKYTGLSGLTTISREFASGMAKRFVIEHANHPSKRSERYLKQLGVSADQVLGWQDNDFSFVEAPGFSAADSEAVKAALVRFVESSVLRPNAAERPVWASDPRFALVWQLKSFLYSFNKVILEGVEREIGRRIVEGTGISSSMAPLMLITMAAFMPLAALGLELREYAKVGLSAAVGMDGAKFLRSDKMDWGTYFGEVFGRAGLDGPIGMLTMAQRNGDWGGSALATLLGPTAELLDKTINDGPFDTAYGRLNSPPEAVGALLGIAAITPWPKASALLRANF